ncbi:hypothetical protein LCDVSa008L [Lymphocystis disease virus 3]|uniref:Uncharacterized protein n=1 Tax=Lymphocystis disease virus 3 TaxID=2560566 RepID=A0A1B2RVS0_9VIRU|nr:hypothetical protein BZK12_gp008 [Lymphocystis disease virus Sa]AOC55092.1 hypothetical protein LCDVSa008L [Lymphocystis disease virus 3]
MILMSYYFPRRKDLNLRSSQFKLRISDTSSASIFFVKSTNKFVMLPISAYRNDQDPKYIVLAYTQILTRRRSTS